MEAFGNYLRKNVDRLAEAVESTTNVPLGKIKVEPLPRCVDEIIEGMLPKHRSLLWLTGRTAIFFMEDFYLEAKAGFNTIYYSRSPLLFLDWKHWPQLAMHELGHIVHHRLLDSQGRREDFYKGHVIPNYVLEGFAETVGIHTMRAMDMVPSLNPNHDGHSKRYKQFWKELREQNISTMPAIIKHTLQY